MKMHWMTLGGLACAGSAQAHVGHGPSCRSHWHAVDVGVLLALALAAVQGVGLGLRRLRRTPVPR